MVDGEGAIDKKRQEDEDGRTSTGNLGFNAAESQIDCRFLVVLGFAGAAWSVRHSRSNS